MSLQITMFPRNGSLTACYYKQVALALSDCNYSPGFNCCTPDSQVAGTCTFSARVYEIRPRVRLLSDSLRILISCHFETTMKRLVCQALWELS